MRLLFFHPLNGSVRDLHRFVLTRCAVVALMGLSGFPGGHFAEGDRVELGPAPSFAARPGAASVALGASSTPTVDASGYRRSSWALGDAPRRARQAVRRSARGEGFPLEMARFDAPLSDVPFELAY